MPFVSDLSHGKPYIESLVQSKNLKDIAVLLNSLAALDIEISLKKRMVNHAIWLVNEVSGGFKSRYRSSEVVKGLGDLIQRDHVYQRELLVNRLLKQLNDAHEIVRMALTCTVTKSEHDRLTEYCRTHPEIDGWAKYAHVNITIYDMSDISEVNCEKL